MYHFFWDTLYTIYYLTIYVYDTFQIISVMRWPSNNTLMGIAGIFGFGVAGTGFYMHNKIQKNFKQTVFVSESLSKLRNHEAVQFLLGIHTS